jgi:transcription elongation factor GreA-like protein
MDYSLVREEIVIEFEYVVGKKYFSFENAFTHLKTLPCDHFLSRRFGDPDKLEAEGLKDPVQLIRDLLRDLGPKTAAEIKEELWELVIPEDQWSKWWQAARGKTKKDTFIATPANVREPFSLRDSEVSHGERFLVQFEKAKNTSKKIE